MTYYDMVKVLKRKGWSSLKFLGPEEVWIKGDITMAVPYVERFNKYVAKKILSDIYRHD